MNAPLDVAPVKNIRLRMECIGEDKLMKMRPILF